MPPGQASILILDHFDVFGGAQLYILDMIGALKADRYRFFCTDVLDDWSRQRLQQLGVTRIPLFPYFSKRSGVFALLRSFMHLMRLRGKAGTPDLLLTNSMPGLLVARLAFGRSLPVVHIAHRMDYGPILRVMLRRWPDRLVTVSQTAANWFREIGVPPDRIRIVPNGFDPALHQRVETSPKPGLCLGMVGRLDREKGMEDLLELARRLAGRQEIRFRLVGAASDPAQDRLWRTLAERDGLLPMIEFAGRKPPGPALFEGMDLLLNLSNFQETFGRSYAEAALLEIPTLAYRNGAPEEWIEHGRNGWFIDSVDSLQTLVEELVREPDRVRLAGKEARRTILANFSLGECAEQLKAILEERLAGPH
ncbi:MAG: glycosyltransferase family 4 protein [Candidatus Delongbacteria bacterium]|nr:glycosyltransferase family 4 protein [Candidatus Cloacimonadota bacterium]MCB9473821.1 glycosyltransferase family 4 protein [Candidatus Delongbacteria bacterium]